jgi:ubiquinol-cytochrome c reductase cytochrome b subunit
VERRLPILSLLHNFVTIRTPKNLNWMWIWGVVLVLRPGGADRDGIILAMHYTPHVDMAFASVEHIMRNVNGGHMIRYFHQNGASLMFFAVYLHIFRTLYYGNYKTPREDHLDHRHADARADDGDRLHGLRAALGPDVVPRHSVITGLFGAIPFVGESIQTWLLGASAVGQPALNRFFSLHYLLPFILLGLTFVHFWAFHTTGNNNPTGVEVRRSSKEEAVRDTVPFWPYFVLKDLYALAVVMAVFWAIVSFMPTISGTRTTTSRRIRSSRPRTSCRNGTSCPSTRSCGPSRATSGW